MILVFAKAPVSGQVKTRLQPHLSAAKAAALYQRMLEHCVSEMLKSGQEVVVYTSGPEQHACWAALSRLGVRRFYPQRGSDLGERMSSAVHDQQVAGAATVILVGGDCPALDATYVAAAEAALHRGNDVVLGPASDGGYVLLALRRHYPQLFEGIPWSSEQVLAASLQVCQQLKLSVSLLPVLTDIDRPEDLVHVPVSWLD